MHDLKIVFFGTPDYVVPVVQTLYKTFKKSVSSPITAVVTQAPKPSGRNKKLTYSEVDHWAYKKKLPIFHKSTELISKKIKADLGIVASYGEIIPKKVIDIFPYGILNIHPSLLPRFRGAAPVQATLVTGDESAGVTIFKISERLDDGPIVSQFSESINDDDTTESLRARLFLRATEVLIPLIPAYLRGKIRLTPQREEIETFTRTLTKQDAFIHPKFLSAGLEGKSLKTKWKVPFIKNYSLLPNPQTLDRFIRAMHPWPGSWTHVVLTGNQAKKVNRKIRLKIIKAHLEPLYEDPGGQKAKSRNSISKSQIGMDESQNSQSKDRKNKLVIDIVQLEGKNEVSWRQFKEGYPNLKFN